MEDLKNAKSHLIVNSVMVGTHAHNPVYDKSMTMSVYINNAVKGSQKHGHRKLQFNLNTQRFCTLLKQIKRSIYCDTGCL